MRTPMKLVPGRMYNVVGTTNATAKRARKTKNSSKRAKQWEWISFWSFAFSASTPTIPTMTSTYFPVSGKKMVRGLPGLNASVKR